MLDDALIDMARGYVEALVAYCAKRNLALYGICWDTPLAFNTSCDPAELLAVSHAIGVFCGIAAGLDVTPIALLDTLGYDPDAINTLPEPAPVTAKRRRARAASPTVKAKAVKP